MSPIARSLFLQSRRRDRIRKLRCEAPWWLLAAALVVVFYLVTR